MDIPVVHINVCEGCCQRVVRSTARTEQQEKSWRDDYINNRIRRHASS